MPKFIIRWDAGYGDDHEIIEAENLVAAEKQAYESWRMAAEDQSDYSAEPYSQDRAVELSLEDEPDEEEAAE